MAHLEQIRFCIKVYDMYSKYFEKTRVLDCGSLDVNGTNRYLFEKRCNYTGIDLISGRNVDVVAKIHELEYRNEFDTIICTEVFEHDKYFGLSIKNIYKMLKPGGLFIMTCAGVGRAEHGTSNVRPESSPGTNDYYKGLSQKDFEKVHRFNRWFNPSIFEENKGHNDLYFHGIKK